MQLCQRYFYSELPRVVQKKSTKIRNKYNEYYYTRYDIIDELYKVAFFVELLGLQYLTITG